MTPYFVGNPVTRDLYLITLAAWAAGELRQAFRRRPEAARADRGSVYLIRLYIAVAMAAALVAQSKLPAAAIGLPAFDSVVALLVMWAGIALRWWAFFALGRYFTIAVATSAEQPVVGTGPYRYLRHPACAGLELIAVGVGCALGNWVSVASWTRILLIGLLVRIRIEETALTATLGDAYRRYAAGRARMIPFVW